MPVYVSSVGFVNGIPGKEVLGIKMKWLKTLGTLDGASSDIGNESLECLKFCAVCVHFFDETWGHRCEDASWVSEMKSIKTQK